MSNSSATCISDVPQSLLPNITACQSSATTPFCWPPNGTRICVPAPSGISFYWPISYYPESSRVLIEYDLSSNIFPARNNTGNTTQSITKYMYEQHALAIPGAPTTERALKMYMRTKQEGKDVINHEGPTLVLVKTAEYPSPSSRPTGSGSYNNDDDKDALTGLTSGQMAGIIVGIIVAIIAGITLCCCYGCCACCGVKPRAARAARRSRMDEEEQAKVVAQGMELMEQKGSGAPRTGETRPPTLDPGRGAVSEEIGVASTVGGDANEIRMVELDVGRDRSDPPPKYTP